MTIRLKKGEPVHISCSADIYKVMQPILLRESRIDRNQEHFWVICMDTANTILNID
jgi:DNA repair protein RadC